MAEEVTELANAINGRMWVNKLLWALITVVFLGIVGLGKYNFDCDARREVEAKEARADMQKQYEEEVSEINEKINEINVEVTKIGTIQEVIKDNIKEMKDAQNKDMEEIKKLIRTRNGRPE